MIAAPANLDAVDRQIIEATQGGLLLVPRPYDEVGVRIGVKGSSVRARLRKMLEAGIIRRIGAIPNHFALGMTANGMSVWDLDDAAVAWLGPQVGALEFVTHCYTRPRHPPQWPYNLFAMVHGHSRQEVLQKVEQISRLLGQAAYSYDVLFSTRILKKTGLRLQAAKG
jgi:DNA-binding Lrp family transcriptional regulator